MNPSKFFIVDARLQPWQGRLVPPVVAAHGRVHRRRGWWLHLADGAGHVGIGEAAPLAGYGGGRPVEVGAALAAFASNVETAHRAGNSIPIATSASGIAAAVAALALPAAAALAVEQALLELLAQRTGCSVAVLLGGTDAGPLLRQQLVADAAAAEVACAERVAALKIKVGAAPLAADVARVAAVAAVAAGRTRPVTVRLDANGAYSLAEARIAVEAFATVGVEWLEQPVAARDVAALAALRRDGRLPVAADESCRTPADLSALLAAAAIDAVVLKPMCIGSLVGTVALARQAAAAGVRVVVTTCLDGPVAEAAVVAVSRACPPVGFSGCGLDRRLVLARRPAVGDLGTDVRDRASPRARRRGVGTSVPHPVASAARARPLHPALVADLGPDVHETLNWRQMAGYAARFAGWLTGLGVDPGDRVALLAPADAAFVVALHGIGWRGAVAVPLAPGATLADRAAALHLLAPDLVLAAPETPVPAGPWRLRDLPRLADVRHPAWTSAPAAEPEWPLDATRVVLQTSGSTGAAKAVQLTTAQLLFSTFGSAIRLGHDPGDRWLDCLPLHHIGGLAILLRSAWLTTTVELHGRFDAARVARALDAGAVSWVSLVPTQLELVFAARPEAAFPARLRGVLLGGAAADPDLLDRCQRLGIPVARTWGMTETAAQVATGVPGDLAAGIGAPLAFARVHAEDDGTLVVTGPIAAGGSCVTGDRGAVDADGRVHVHGRRDRVLVRGGVNVAPEPVEAALCRHPAVAAALVLGIADPTWGEVPVAAIAVRAGFAIDAETLDRHLAPTCPSPARPVRYVWLDALPMSATGKPLAAEIRRRFDEPDAGEPVPHRVRHLPRTEAAQFDEGVDVADRGTHATVLRPLDFESECDRPLAQIGDDDGHAQAIAQAHGRAEVGIGVNQRHAPALDLEHRSQPSGCQQFFKGFMAVLEGSAEERDAGAVDVLEADGDDVVEGHEAVLGARARAGTLRRWAPGHGAPGREERR